MTTRATPGAMAMQLDSWGCSTRTTYGAALQSESLPLEVEALA